MIRWTSIVWIALLVIAGGTVMRVSYQVRHVQEHLFALDRDARREQDAIRILGAEWETLNDPARIDSLARRYLQLEATPIQRVVRLEAIPLKPSEEQLSRLAGSADRKPAKTGARPAPKNKEAKPALATPTEPAIEIKARAGGSAAPRRPEHAPARTAPPHPDPALDPLGVILARAERQP